jgi:hypothetical protein
VGEVPEEFPVARVPSPEGLVKLTPSFEHHEQGPKHQNQGQQEH